MDTTRKVHLDILRIIAAFAVVMYHILISSASNDVTISSYTRSIIMAFSSTIQWHIPVFFMITGYLWLDEDKKCTFSKIVPNIKRFILVLLTFGYVYAIIERIYNFNEISLTTIIYSFIDVLKGNSWDHMWFLYATIGVYILLPILKPFFDSQPTKLICIVWGILFFFTIINPIIEYIFKYSFPIDFPITKPAFYAFTGGMLTKIKTPSKTITQIALIVLISNTLIIFITRISNFLDGNLLTILIYISAVSLFITIIGFFNNKKESSLIYNISICTFGIYLIHPFFINLIIKFLHIYPFKYYSIISVLSMFIVIAVLSYFITYILRKISFIRKYIL